MTLKRHVVRSTLQNVVGVLVGLLLALLSLGLVASFLSAPIDVAWCTWDMTRMRCVAQARIDKVGLRASPGWALVAPDVSYSYRVAGKQYRSRRFLPGFLPNHTVWSTGDAAVYEYRPGDQVLIHYDPADPQRSCLEYGWFKWSVAVTVVCLLIPIVFAVRPEKATPYTLAVGPTLLVTALLLVACHTVTVSVMALLFHALGAVATYVFFVTAVANRIAARWVRIGRFRLLLVPFTTS
jgi:hypothetical protein